MRWFKCEHELADIVRKVGYKHGFELNTRQLPFLVVTIAAWINQNFGLEEDPILKRMKTQWQLSRKCQASATGSTGASISPTEHSKKNTKPPNQSPRSKKSFPM